MKNRNYHILVISSRPPSYSAGLGKDIIKSLENAGHVVDFLTTYNFKNQTKNQYSIKAEPLILKLSQLRQQWTYLRKLAIIKNILFNRKLITNRALTYPNENKPPIPTKKITTTINSNYDFIITLFWEGLITTASLKAIFDKLKCPILIYAVDMGPFTGGCYYFRECDRYTSECGMCPILKSNSLNDPTHYNYLYKKEVYNNIQVAFLSNTYVNRFAQKANLFNSKHIYCISFVLDEHKFKPLNVDYCRKRFHIPKEKTFILFSRYSKELNCRKGINHLVSSVNTFYNSLSKDKKQRTLLLLAGEEYDSKSKYFDMDVINLGFITEKRLIEVYSASSIFLNTSIDDAGPSMVNQSMMCGTPVVSFNLGTAQDMITNINLGYKAEKGNSYDFCNGIKKIFNLNCDEYQKMRVRCREQALKLNSMNAFSTRIIEIYESFKTN